MSEQPEKKWEPMRSRWGLQIDVVEGMLDVLKNRELDVIDRLVACIIERSTTRDTVGTTKIELEKIIRNRYGGVSDKAYAQFERDMREQRAYLLQQPAPPSSRLRMSIEERNEIVRRHTVRLQQGT